MGPLGCYTALFREQLALLMINGFTDDGRPVRYSLRLKGLLVYTGLSIWIVVMRAIGRKEKGEVLMFRMHARVLFFTLICLIDDGTSTAATGLVGL